MPNIREYRPAGEVPGIVQGPRANADTFGANIGASIERAGGAIMNAADIVQKNNERAEISDLNAKLAKAQADWTIEWNETLKTADPADKTLAERFNQGLEERLAGVREGIETRAGELHFEQSSSRLKAHFAETAYQGQSTLAGIKAKEDYEQARNSRQAALINDPSAFQLTLEMENEDVESRVANGLPRATAEQLRNESRLLYAKAALRGWAKLDPSYAKEQLASGQWDQFLSGEAKVQMVGEADQEIRGRMVEAERLRAANERIVKEQQEKTQTEFLTKIVQGSLKANDILSSNLDFAQRHQMLNILDSHNKSELKTDKALMADLFDRIHTTEDDPRKIKDEKELNAFVVQKKLTIEDLNVLRKEFQGRTTSEGKAEGDWKQDFYRVARGKLTKSNDLLGVKDPEGDERYLQFRIMADKAIEDGKKAGKSPAQLLNPESPDYVGKALSSFVKSGRQIMKEKAGRMRPQPSVTPAPTPTPLPRQPGEKPADYLKRIGK